ncbi:hypothetical protein B0H67DRAFT_602903 [Lasiosphaeris hirsuta]|uniref:Uncharacterized protein n=1 Tax=Lasiosphaeris hirsuta TaxID=260670 RepID=A0AA40DNT0_9PEZI|nr:hypothetical protein B0H67DRAFT_602903 [Lasiosphaeris hirsuta]
MAMTEIPAETASDNAAYVRLHVTPLDEDLLKVVLSATLLPKACNISYHTIETFPDKRYGFLELPNEDADKLRKKLNGSVLKGVKLRIERARPSSILEPLGAAAMADPQKELKKRKKDGERKDKSKKRKLDNEIVGVVLEEGRTVKRGWTTAEEPNEKDKKEKRSKKEKTDKAEKSDRKEKKDKGEKRKQSKSKYTDHAECLVKTILPAATSAPAPADADNDATIKKKKKSKSREVIVHEFQNTTKFPTFLKSTVASGLVKAPLEFVDGKGWVDEDGNVVEPVKTRPAASLGVKPTKKAKPVPQMVVSDDSSSDQSSDDSGSDSESEVKAKPALSTDVVSPDVQTAPENAQVGAEAVPQPPAGSPSLLKSDPARPKSSSSVRSLTIKIPPATPPKDGKVHPLEALYKRPKQAEGVVAKEPAASAAFSFFGAVNNEAVEEDADEVPTIQVPLTPFSRHDFEIRGMRSAAPTPDTAHPNKRFILWGPDEEKVEEDDDEDDTSSILKDDESNLSDSAGPAQNADAGEDKSDFQKWFWENRGDINRSWRKRRKAVGKEKRYRDNKARMARAV